MRTVCARERWHGVPILLAAVLAGGMAERLRLPAAWLVGPLLAAGAWAAVTGWRVPVPVPLHRAAQAVIGMAVSASFQARALGPLAEHWPALAAVGAVTLLLSVAGGLGLARVAAVDPATALLGTLSGGASGMVAMSDDLGADARVVAFMQYVRLGVVIATSSAVATWLAGASGGAPLGMVLPPEADGTVGGLLAAYALTAAATALGAWLGERLRLPAAALVGPVLAGLALAALGLPHGQWPPGTLAAAYLVLGVAVGSRYDRASLRALARVAPAVLAFVVLLMAASAVLAWALVAWAGLDPLTAYLATAPGGIEAATAAALDAGADAPLVLTAHVVRILVVILAGPPLVRRLLRGRQPSPVPGAGLDAAQ